MIRRAQNQEKVGAPEGGARRVGPRRVGGPKFRAIYPNHIKKVLIIIFMRRGLGTILIIIIYVLAILIIYYNYNHNHNHSHNFYCKFTEIYNYKKIIIIVINII